VSLEQFRKQHAVSRLHVAGTQVEIVRSAGRRSPTILLPGAQGTAEIFFKQLSAWGGERDMVSVTYPAWTDTVALADFIVGLADVLGFKAFDIVGSSFGGHVAQWVAVRHPDRIGRLVAGNSFADPTPAQAPDKLAALETKAADDLKTEAMARLEASPAGELRDVLLELVGHRQSAELLKSRMVGVQMSKPLPSPRIPTARVLLIDCDNDPLIPAPMRAAIRAHYGGAACQTIVGGGHYPYIVKSVEYNAAVGAFLS
jgi:pimeloyl-ACP methyl ester carboxylesterase